MKNIFLNHHSFLLTTDLEPDDVIAIIKIVQAISKQAESSSDPLKLTIVLGEGNSNIKYAFMEKLIERFKSINLLQNMEVECLVDVECVRGFSNFNGSQEGYIDDGKPLLNDEEIQSILKKPIEDKTATLQKIKSFLATNDNTLVIAMKPFGEFLEIEPDLFHPHTLVAYGSYNFRETWKSTDKNTETELKKKVLTMLNAFAASYIYERWFTVQQTCYSLENDPELFESIIGAKDQSILNIINIMIHNWNNHIIKSQFDDYGKYLEVLFAKNIFTESEKTFLKQVNPESQNKKLYSEIKALIESKLQVVTNNDEPVFEKLKRGIILLENLTSSMQFVNADADLIAVVTGSCEHAITAAPANFSFNGAKTGILPPTSDTNTYVFLPGADTSVEKYLQWQREQSNELKAAQANLFSVLKTSINDSLKQIEKIERDIESKPSTATRYLHVFSHYAKHENEFSTIEKEEERGLVPTSNM